MTYPKPTVSISANPINIQPGESVTLTWSSTNAVSVVMEPGFGSVALSGSMTLSPAGTTTYMIKATGPGGTASCGVTVTVPSQLLLNITSPSVSATINRPDVMVTGMIANAAENDVGVTVNGVVALVSGNLFAANHVPLTEGENIITVTATAADGVTTTASITVNASYTGRNYITLTADPESGVSPLQPELEVDGTYVITSPSITYTGPGTATQLSVADNTYKMEINGPGIYFFTAEALYEGTIFTDTVAVLALDQAELDALLQAKWNRIKTVLINGDIPGALDDHQDLFRDKYQAVYIQLGSGLSAKIQQMQDISFIYATGDRAKYRIRRNHVVEGQSVTITYYVYPGVAKAQDAPDPRRPRVKP